MAFTQEILMKFAITKVFFVEISNTEFVCKSDEKCREYGKNFICNLKYGL